MSALCYAEFLPIRNDRACRVNGIVYQNGHVVSYNSISATLRICLGGQNTIIIYGKRDTEREQIFRERMGVHRTGGQSIDSSNDDYDGDNSLHGDNNSENVGLY